MSGKEIVNLINCLKSKGMSSEEIINIILYIETTEVKTVADNDNEKE